MLRKLIGVALAIAALVALGDWAQDMFFPQADAQDWRELDERFGWTEVAAAAQEASAPEVTAGRPTASPSASFRAVSLSASATSTVKPSAIPSPTVSPIPSETPQITAIPTSAMPSPIIVTPTPTTLSPSPTAAATIAITPAPTEEPTVYEGMDSAYIDGILCGLNERRAANGLPLLSLNASISQKAQGHAMSMAKEGGGWFHLRAGMIEDSNYHHVSDAPSTIGARASQHAPELCMGDRITEDDSAIVTAKVVSVGIGAVRVGDRVYTCLLGEDSVTFQIKATPEPSATPSTSTETEG